MNLVRIVPQNDWVVLVIAGCIFLYIFMLTSLHRGYSVREYLLKKFQNSVNIFLSWLIISLVFCLVFSMLLLQYVEYIPYEIRNFGFEGYSINNFGFTFFTVLVFYLTKNLFTYIFFITTDSYKRWKIFYFMASKFYFVFSIILMILCVICYLYDIDKNIFLNIFSITIFLLFLIKQLYYSFNTRNILPQKWYYKMLYICTLQILPALALCKVLIFKTFF
jgi:hypothetical protein